MKSWLLLGLIVASTVAALLITVVYTPVTERLRRGQDVVGELSLTYRQGTGVLRQVIAELTRSGCTVETLSVAPSITAGNDVCVVLEVRGPTRMAALTTPLAHIHGVIAVRIDLGSHGGDEP